MWPFRKKAVPEISWFSGESPAMNRAIAEAQEGFGHFSEVVSGETANVPRPEIALVKYAFKATRPGAVVEHVFVGDIYRQDEALWGTVNADPVYTDEVSEGDVIRVDRDRVSDWLYVIDQRGVGGFTFRTMWRNFSREERDLYRNQPPFLWLADQLP